ncbi:MAG: UPF0182 family protein [Elusimicrobiota bacterium]
MNLIIPAVMAALVARLMLAGRRRNSVPSRLILRDAAVAVAFILLVSKGSGFAIDYSWWKELGQVGSFWRLLAVRWLPQSLAAAIGAAVLAIAFALSKRRAVSPLSKNPFFGVGGFSIAIFVGIILGFGFIDPWTAALWHAAPIAQAYRDPFFHKDLGFYFFSLPFYEMLADWLGGLALCALLLYAAGVIAGAPFDQLIGWGESLGLGPAPEVWDEPRRVYPQEPRVSLAPLLRAGAALALILFAAAAYFGRYGLLYSQHRFLYGMDYVDANLGVPFYWFRFFLSLGLALAALIAPRRNLGVLRSVNVETSPFSELPRWLFPVLAAGFAAALLLPPIVEQAARSLYVEPNELTLERPFISDHIDSTLAAYNLSQNAHEESFIPHPADALDLSKHPDVAQNILLWDHQPFLDNAAQLQALRPYYAFPSVATDRYLVNGKARQVLIAARGLETDLLPDAAQTWVNLNLQYTHGYGAVAALVDSATGEGAPDFSLKDAPPRSDVPSLNIARPQIYFGEESSRPVFADGSQQEFDYPKGDDNAYTTYDGAGGIPIGSWLMRTAAALSMGDWNILLTRYLTPASKLLLHRQIMDRVGRLAPFLTLDPHPYLVIDGSGRLFWMIDAYTSSDLNPDSKPIGLDDGTEINYVRNSVKITVDAYNGSVRFYVFDEGDPLLQAYRGLFPDLFLPRSAMPPDLLSHIRYPEFIFDLQSQTYRSFHMRDPQVFYNKEDQWDVAKQVSGQDVSELTSPYYVMVRLPGDAKAEFVLMLPFTSHNRDNLVAWVAARCDPEHYGQIIFYRLPKDQLIYGPLQIQSRISQNRSISKDLSLWNQQGSRVVRGNARVLPVGGTFLYVEPIYIQATQAKLPELKKIVLGVGDRLAYSDTLSQAIAELAKPAPISSDGADQPAPPSIGAPGLARGLVESLREHMMRYRQLTSQGRLSQAGRELEALERELKASR